MTKLSMKCAALSLTLAAAVGFSSTPKANARAPRPNPLTVDWVLIARVCSMDGHETKGCPLKAVSPPSPSKEVCQKALEQISNFDPPWRYNNVRCVPDNPWPTGVAHPDVT
jgi:hypothetical protein